MRWEDQEYNQDTEHQFYEVTHVAMWLMSTVSREPGHFTRIDQAKLNEIIQSGKLINEKVQPPDFTERLKGVQIYRLCLCFRMRCGLQPEGGRFPNLGVCHFWILPKKKWLLPQKTGAESHYSILYISPKNEWFDMMGIRGESPGESPNFKA